MAVFGLFKKKKEEPAPTASENPELSRERREFAAQFLPEETDILAITGPAGFGGSPMGQSGLWQVSLGLTAWKDEYIQELHREPARLEAVVDDKLLEYLRERVPRNFIISVTARPSEDGGRFLMTDLPKPAFDPELKALLEEQKKPVTLEAEGLGAFTLNRALGWFEAAVDWMGAEISLSFDRAEETRDAAQETARALLAAQEDWDKRVRGFAAEQLLDRANTLLEEDGQGETLTREDFLAQLELESILAGPEGGFEFWFSGDDLFLAHPVHVTGNLKEGPLQAVMEEEA